MYINAQDIADTFMKNLKSETKALEWLRTQGFTEQKHLDPEKCILDEASILIRKSIFTKYPSLKNTANLK